MSNGNEPVVGCDVAARNRPSAVGTSKRTWRHKRAERPQELDLPGTTNRLRLQKNTRHRNIVERFKWRNSAAPRCGRYSGKGAEPGMVERVEDHRGDMLRIIYVVRLARAVYVLLCF